MLRAKTASGIKRCALPSLCLRIKTSVIYFCRSEKRNPKTTMDISHMNTMETQLDHQVLEKFHSYKLTIVKYNGGEWWVPVLLLSELAAIHTNAFSTSNTKNITSNCKHKRTALIPDKQHCQRKLDFQDLEWPCPCPKDMELNRSRIPIFMANFKTTPKGSDPVLSKNMRGMVLDFFISKS
ncbi:hypothetical protein EVAR_73674_1 [Eumeta japonica]|uniref:Uncharacterized protein n=1 Tax=Eumeta variegata TaxID=151549 RepID=A0A4C1T3D0_EUMVA|nr:hypothetical protein EVAR_73674_1 [Eumeta japonica]